MIAEIDDFRWHVCTGGYQCQAGTTDAGARTRVVVPNLRGPDWRLDERRPLDVPTLHRDFAVLDVTEKAVVAFAAQWGPLKNAHRLMNGSLDPDAEDVDLLWTGDPVDFWFQEIRRMKALVALHDVLKGGQGKSLSDLVEVQKRGEKTFWNVTVRFRALSTLTWTCAFSERSGPGFSGLMGPGGKHAVARKCLIELINESLRGSCSAGVGIGRKTDELVLLVSPHNLDAALWLLFVQETLGQKRLRQCLQCKRLFDASAEQDQRRQRSDRKYCSARCRATAFRERHEKQPLLPNQ